MTYQSGPHNIQTRIHCIGHTSTHPGDSNLHLPLFRVRSYLQRITRYGLWFRSGVWEMSARGASVRQTRVFGERISCVAAYWSNNEKNCQTERMRTGEHFRSRIQSAGARGHPVVRRHASHRDHTSKCAFRVYSLTLLPCARLNQLTTSPNDVQNSRVMRVRYKGRSRFRIQGCCLSMRHETGSKK